MTDLLVFTVTLCAMVVVISTAVGLLILGLASWYTLEEFLAGRRALREDREVALLDGWWELRHPIRRGLW